MTQVRLKALFHGQTSVHHEGLFLICSVHLVCVQSPRSCDLKKSHHHPHSRHIIRSLQMRRIDSLRTDGTKLLKFLTQNREWSFVVKFGSFQFPSADFQKS